MKTIFFLASFGKSVATKKINVGDPICTEIVTGILSQIVILLGIEIRDLDLEELIQH